MEKAAKLEGRDAPEKIDLRWTQDKVGIGVSVGGDGGTASRQASGWGVQLADHWMAGAGKNPMVWTVAVALDEVEPDTCIGIVGRNYWPSDWADPLTSCQHAIVMRCGDGRISYKGKNTSFVLRPLTSGARLHLVLDMQTRELTFELLTSKPGLAPVVTGSVTVDGIPAELTLAVGFASGGRQSVRVAGCTREKPDMKLLGKMRKDLWDDDNIIKPLPLNVKKERGLRDQQLSEMEVAQSLDT